MPKDPRILNLTRGFRLKHNQAIKAINQCACVWVEVGVSVRDLTIAESIIARNEQAKNREPLPNAELPGISFQAPAQGLAMARAGYGLIMRANEFCAVGA